MFRLLTTSLLAILCLHLPAAHGKPAQAEKADAIQIAKIPDIPPAKPEQFDQAFRRGVDFLLKTQNRDGSWGDHPLPLSGRPAHLQDGKHRPVHCGA